MAARELVVLGSGSQTPTRQRNHNGYLLRWDGAGILFDPGEGTQRQLLLAGVSPSAITAICITHFHGDHCLGLPGILQRLSLDAVAHPVHLLYPASGQDYLDRLRRASVYDDRADVRPVPVFVDGVVLERPGFTLHAARLDHRPEAFGWRLQEPDGIRMVPDRLTALGVRGPDVGRLQRSGVLEVDGRTVALEQVSAHRPGQSMAFVMDTALCDAAVELATDVDLLVCEATFAESDIRHAARWNHLTARQAGAVARRAGARRLLITHFSQRYPDVSGLVAEAGAEFPAVVAAEDLMTVAVPPRTYRGQIPIV